MKKYFDKTGKEIKPGMSIYFGSETSGTCLPVVLHKRQLCFDMYANEYMPLDDVNLSNGIINYDPEKEDED